MEARPWRSGEKVTYRYHPVGGKPINLGCNRDAAIQRVWGMLNAPPDATALRGTVNALWDTYQQTPEWRQLRERTQADYQACIRPLQRVFGKIQASAITAADIARYLRVERAAAPVRANREIALLGNLISLAIDRGEALSNPCRGRQVRRNRERPRTISPSADELQQLISFAKGKRGQARIIVGAAEFAALCGCRQAELLRLRWDEWPPEGPTLTRAKQRRGVVKTEFVASSEALKKLRDELNALATHPQVGFVFRNREGNAYTSSGFATQWQKLKRSAIDAKIISTAFTFHDLRAFYTTQHKQRTGTLPDLHASPATTQRVYERSRIATRMAL
jgi:integrase